MNPKRNNPMNLPFHASYRSVMRDLIVAILLVVLCLALSFLGSSCTSKGFHLASGLPFDLGLKYQIEPGLFVVATPADKGGLDLSFEGDGEIGKYVRREGNSWFVTGPKTGAIYQITRQDNGRPKIQVVAGGSGHLQLVPAAPAVIPEK